MGHRRELIFYLKYLFIQYPSIRPSALSSVRPPNRLCQSLVMKEKNPVKNSELITQFRKRSLVGKHKILS